MTTPKKIKTTSNILRKTRTPGGSPRNQKIKRLTNQSTRSMKPDKAKGNQKAKNSWENFSSILSKWENLTTGVDAVLTSTQSVKPQKD